MLNPETLKPPFCRQGNKIPMKNDIIPYIPPHDTYVELFAGSAAIFFNKAKAKKNVLNDLDKNTANNLRMMQKAPTDLGKYKQGINNLQEIKSFYNNHGSSQTDKILLEKIRTCSGFSGLPVNEKRGTKGIYKSRNLDNFVKEIPEWREALKGVKITSKDYADIVRQYDGVHTFFFIDPPYEKTSKTAGYAQGAEFDFERLEETLQRIKGKFLMTINDSPRIRQLFKSFTIKPVNVQTGWNNQKQARNKGAPRKELIITNYIMKRG